MNLRLFIMAVSLLSPAFLTQMANASMILTSDISQSEFNDSFNTVRIWYVQLQPGGTGTSNLNKEFKLGGSEDAYYRGDTSIVDETANPFVIDVSSSNFLTVTFNGVGTPGGYAYGIGEAYNTIWIGLKADYYYGPLETLDVNNHEADKADTDFKAILPDMSLSASPDWVAFKFYLDDKPGNIGEVTITGDVIPDMRFGGSTGEDWTYTVFATYDPSIVPEPSASVLLIGGLMVVYLNMCKRF